MIYLLLKSNKSIAYFIPIIGLYVGASYKLLPALNRIIVNAQKLKRSALITFRISSQLKNYEKNKKTLDKILMQKSVAPFKFKKNIILKDISFKYPGKNNFIFENINLNIKKGETIGIIGKSGEGKSTLANILCGFITPTSGSILVDDFDIQINLRKWRAVIGYIPQLTYLFNDTISNNICFYSDNKKNSKKKFEKVIKISQLAALIKENPLHKETMVGERGILLSGGQAQRIALARTIYKDPQILILDEATSSLDAENEKGILEAIKSFKGKKTIIIISHRERTLSFCDKIYKVKNKKCTEITFDKI
jgi:ABC-type bacteriocin/lantibiotic exporter with double-glycine peptidase domain